jgi:predicted N-formylglutamate amidohydrolase
MQALILSCEHGGNEIPQDCAKLFKGEKKILESHSGYDIGALELAKDLAQALNVTLFFSTTTRLLIDLNRSLSNKFTLFSSITNHLSKEQKEKIIRDYYEPYRIEIKKHVKQLLKSQKCLIHLSVHSFTPELNQLKRKADIGLLYDSKRKREQRFCQIWKETLSVITKEPLIIRKNYPYRGSSDGLTTYFRSVYDENQYLGIELEINQKHPLSGSLKWQSLKIAIIQSLKQSWQNFND